MQRARLIALVRPDLRARVRDLGERGRRRIRAHRDPLGSIRQREPLERPLLLVANDPRELAPHLDGDIVEVRARRRLHGLGQRRLGRGEVASAALHLPAHERRLRDERRPAELARPLLRCLGACACLGPLAGPEQRLDPRELRARGVDRGALRGIVGRRDHRGQRLAIRARVDRREVADRLDGTGHARGIGPRDELIDERVQLVEATREAAHPQIEELRALLAAHPGRAARLAVHRGPLGRARGERRADLAGRLPREARAGRAKRLLEPRGDRVVPHALEVTRGVLARLRRGRARRDQRGETTRGDHRGGRERDPAAAPRRIRGERGQELVHRAIAVRGRGSERAGQDLAHPRGRLAACGRRAKPTTRARVEIAPQILADERPRPVQELPARHRERELIGARVERALPLLLRCHVRGRAGDPARDDLRQALIVRGVGIEGLGLDGLRDRRHLLAVAREGQPRHAEIEDAHATIRADDRVLRLEVAVDEPGRVRRREPAPRLDQVCEQRAPRRFALALPLRERPALDELHRDEHGVAEHADIEDLDDVRVRDLRQRLGLADQPRGAVGADRAHELERDAPVEIRIVGAIDHAHAAETEAIEDDVASHARTPRERGRGSPRRFRHEGLGLDVLDAHAAPLS